VTSISRLFDVLFLYGEDVVDFKGALSTVNRKYFKPFVVLVLVFGGAIISAATYLVAQYQELEKQKEQLLLDQKRLGDDRAAVEKLRTELEKRRADVEIALNARSLALDKREFVVGMHEQENGAAAEALSARSAAVNESAARVNALAQTVSTVQQTAAAETKLEALMSEFVAMGVDLDEPPPCNDPKAQAIYNRAKAKYGETYAFAAAHGLRDRYSYFFGRASLVAVQVCPEQGAVHAEK
jgi:uncharacterized membrane protein